MIFRIEHLAGFFDGEGCIGIYRTSSGGLRWYGSSNGYYSESVSFRKV